MSRGNRGANLMGIFEVQIFDSYNTRTYPDGQAAAVYGQTPPLVNVSRKPREWQTYEIIFSVPVYIGGKLERRPRVTLFHNGILVHYNQEIYGGVSHTGRPAAFEQGRVKGPLILSGHNNPIRFLNICLRPL